MNLSRRDFLQLIAATACPDPFIGGRRIGTVPFVDTDRVMPLDRLTGSGLDARLSTDLSNLTADTLVMPASKYFVRTSAPELPDDARDRWTIRVNGLVKEPSSVSIKDLERIARSAGPFVTECAGNSSRAGFGLISAATWSGARVGDVLKNAHPLDRATRVRISGVDRHAQPSTTSIAGASWVFTLDQIESSGAMLATRMNGEPLPRDHGRPVRLLVPGWYGCTCIKWVDEITLVDDSEPATSQMKEFAGRTHQNGVPELAKDYAPASMDLAAFPIRVEKWVADSKIVYRVVGIMWGGAPTTRLQIQFNPLDAFQPFDVCPAPSSTLTWTLWTYVWRPASRGRYEIALKPEDPSTPARRLESHYYARQVWIAEV